MSPENDHRKLVILAAPSGAGKTSIARGLMRAVGQLEFSVSACTRKRRIGEIDGVHYYFLSTEDFLQKVSNNEFIEWEEVYTNMYYGTLRSEIDRIWNDGNIALFDIDIQGAINLKKQFGEQAITIFVQPPSIETLESRLRSRNTEDEESIRSRIAKANSELQFANQFDHIVVNDDLEKAVKKTTEILFDRIGAQYLNH